MDFGRALGPFVLVGFGMVGPALCLFFGWLIRNPVSTSVSIREKLLRIGLRLASLSFLLTSSFLLRLHYFISPANQPPEKFWIPLNWLSALCWASVFVPVLLGKGKPRLALFVWTILCPIFAGMVYVSAYAY